MRSAPGVLSVCLEETNFGKSKVMCAYICNWFGLSSRATWAYIYGFGLSIVGGAIVLYIAWLIFNCTIVRNNYRAYKKDISYYLMGPSLLPTLPKQPSHWWPGSVSFLFGIIERLIFTTLIAWKVNGGASFIGSWVTVKAFGMGWQVFSHGSEYGRQLFGVSLVLSGLSAFFGIVGGLLILHLLCS
jgi:hypothetical protein